MDEQPVNSNVFDAILIGIEKVRHNCVTLSLMLDDGLKKYCEELANQSQAIKIQLDRLVAGISDYAEYRNACHSIFGNANVVSLGLGILGHKVNREADKKLQEETLEMCSGLTATLKRFCGSLDPNNSQVGQPVVGIVMDHRRPLSQQNQNK